jgi:Histidine kinase
MRRPAILNSLKARFSSSRWLGIGVFVLLLLASRALEGEPFPTRNILHSAYLFLALVYIYAFSPMPWQWTGDGRTQASFARGLLQALIWNGSWIFLIFVLPLALMKNPQMILGKGEAASQLTNGHISLGDLAFFIFGHSLWAVLVAGWFITYEESLRLAAMDAEETRRTLEQTARQAQAQALQAQLDPHVLYNALSGITELIHEDSRKAESAVVHLSSLYRKLTVLGKQESVRLGEEQQILKDYLAVEQVRLGKRLQVSWDWPESLRDLRIPPLLIQPLVENAIKHGLSPQEEGGNLLISAALTERGRLHAIVANNGCTLDPNWREGTGLANLSARLALIGGILELRQQGSLTVAELQIPIKEAP